MPPADAVNLAYQVMLGRKPDPVGFEDFGRRIRNGHLTRRQMVEAIRGSEEFQTGVRFSGPMLGSSLHAGRCQFIRSLPPAGRIVDLPSEERHPLYQSGMAPPEVRSPLGPVRYRYHSMTDLSDFGDLSVDLVYSGQSIEHVSADEGSVVLKEVFRILRPGGHLALDTPNARVTRLQQAEFIDPDHKVEYTSEELAAKLESVGFEILELKGLNYAGRSLATGRFDPDEIAGNCGLFSEARDCYILCCLCRKPAAEDVT